MIDINPEAVKLMDYINDENDLWNLYTLNCGLHSGFPKCCCIFFCYYWHTISKNNYIKQLNSFGYIPCPSCLFNNNIVKVKKCHCIRQKSMILNGKAIAKRKNYYWEAV